MKPIIATLLLLSTLTFFVKAQQPDTKEMEQQMKEMEIKMKEMEARLKEMESTIEVSPVPPAPPRAPRVPGDTTRRKIIIINGERIDTVMELEGLRDFHLDEDMFDGENMKIFENDDSVVIKIGDLKVKVDDEEVKTMIEKEERIIKLDDEKNKKKDRVEFTSAGFKLGLNNYLNNGTFSTPVGYAPLELTTGKSIHVNIGLAGIKWRINKDYVTLHSGIALDFNNYRLDNDVIIIPESDSVEFMLPAEDDNITKNKLTATYIELPLRLQFATHKKESKAFRISVGGRVAYRVGTHNKLVVNNEKKKVRDDFNFNNVKYGATFQIGFSWLNLYVNYDFSPMFRDGVAPELNPIAAGIVLTNW